MATRISRILALALGLTLATSASAMKGDELAMLADAWHKIDSKKSTDPEDAMKANLFIGYVRGVEDSLQGVRFCITPKATFAQRAGLIIKYIKDNPTEKNNGAPTFIVQAIQPVFPCKAAPPVPAAAAKPAAEAAPAPALQPAPPPEPKEKPVYTPKP
ncbi:MAG: Rap1a/Tai family immunity protein [Rhodanobacteraceae bacterium]